MRVALPNTVRHHGAHIPHGTIVRTMRGQTKPGTRDPRWIEYVPLPPVSIFRTVLATAIARDAGYCAPYAPYRGPVFVTWDTY